VVSDDGAILCELGERLLQSADTALLDARLDALGDQAGSDEARELLAGIFEAGEADTLRELLDAAWLSHWQDQLATSIHLRCSAGSLPPSPHQTSTPSGTAACSHPPPDCALSSFRSSLRRPTATRAAAQSLRNPAAELRAVRDGGRGPSSQA
jgi:hypothetical protein